MEMNVKLSTFINIVFKTEWDLFVLFIGRIEEKHEASAHNELTKYGMQYYEVSFSFLKLLLNNKFQVFLFKLPDKLAKILTPLLAFK
jgi:hypothetical protein